MTTGSSTLGALLGGLERRGHPLRYVGCTADTAVHGLTDDSRAVRPGALFVAIAGQRHDGHAHVPAALAAGAAAVVVARSAGIEHVPRVEVDDPRLALALAASAWWGEPAQALALVGLTGTNGKTTTAHVLSQIMRAAGWPHARLGTTGNHIVDEERSAGLTTPGALELQSLLADTRTRGGRAAVMEVSSHALEQGRAQPLTFRVVALTSFSQDHLDYHGTMAAYLAAKVRLAREHSDASSLALAAGRDRAAITQFLAAAAGAAWRVGSDGDAEVRIEQLEVGGSGLRMELRSPLGSVRLAAPLVGAHNADNAAIAATAALHLGIAADLIEAAGPTLVGAPGRMEPVTVPGIAGPQVLVDYAHTPDAVERALAAARAVCRGRLWVVLGCGGDRDAGKRPAMGAIAARDADVFVATSDNPRSEPPDAIVAAMLAGVAPARRDRVRAIVARDAAIRAAVIEADPDDLVLIAGKGHERQQILATGAIAFDDREHAAAALRAR